MSQHKSSPMCKNMPLSPNSLRAVIWIGGLDLWKKVVPCSTGTRGSSLDKPNQSFCVSQLGFRLLVENRLRLASEARLAHGESNGASMEAWGPWIGLGETRFLFLGDPQSPKPWSFPVASLQKPPNMRYPPKKNTNPTGEPFFYIRVSQCPSARCPDLPSWVDFLCWEALSWLVPAAWF